MNFDFSEDQKLLREHARRFLSETCTFDRLRTNMASDASYDAELWQQMIELGWTGISVAEEHGGMGLGALELCILCEELGRALAPVPFISTIALAAAVLESSSNEQALALLPRIAAGEVIVAVAVADESNSLQLENGLISGSLQPVNFLEAADYLITTVNDSAEEQLVALVNLKDAGVSRMRLTHIALDGLAHHGALTVASTPAQLLVDGVTTQAACDKLLQRAAVLTAFEQIGGADIACEMARDYSLERYTFGRPIGGYQAIKHKLADVRVANELARSNAYYGAWALATNSAELPKAAALARISATEAFSLAAEENMQIHGGIGYTWEANCHFYYQRARLLALNFFDPGWWSEKLLSRVSTGDAHGL